MTPAFVYFYQQNTFDAVFSKVYWRADQRGVLLAVGAQEEAVQPLPAVASYNVQDVASAFDRALFRAGGVSVLAPKTYRRFTRPTLSLEQAVLYSPLQAGSAFLASLSKNQLGQLTGEQGIGWSDLTPQQQPLFLALLPERLTLDPVDTTKPKRHYTGNDRKSLRLRITQRTELTYFIEGGRGTMNFGVDHSKGLGYYLQTSTDTAPDDAALLEKLYPSAPNRLKPSSLDFASPGLDRTVSLAGCKTIHDLLQATQKSTGLRLTADYRVESLPVALRGETARAGDLLQALCLAVCGTLRKVEERTYVLTEDQEGLMVRLAAFDRWKGQVQALALARWKENQKALAQKGLPPPQKQVQVVRTTTLPADLQARVAKDQRQEFYQTTTEGGRVKAAIRTDQVILEKNPETQVVFPGVGGLACESLNLAGLLQAALQPPQPELPVQLPLAGKERVLVLAAATPDEAKEAVALTQRLGLTRLRLAVPAHAQAALPLLQAGRTLGETLGVRVEAQILPLAQPQDTPLAPDKTVLGETVAPLPRTKAVPPHLEMALQIKEELGKLGAGVVETESRGYPGEAFVASFSALGYTNQNRTAFLQQTGSDLIDLPYFEFASFPIPLGYFSVIPDASPVPKQWVSLRKEQLQRFFAALGPQPQSPLRTVRATPDETRESLQQKLKELPSTLPGFILDLSALSFSRAHAFFEAVAP